MAQGTSVYLDHAATTPMRPIAQAAMADELALTGNPSSLHAAGRRARRIVEESRESIAADLGCRPSDVIFTAGGTESNNLSLKGIYWNQRARDARRTHVVVSSIEHPSVLDPAAWLGRHESAEVVTLPVDSEGRVDLAALTEYIHRFASDIAVLSVMWANNELGTVQPVKEIAQLCAESGVRFHCDAVQAVPWMDPGVWMTQATALSVSAHKLGGPVGVGALIFDDAKKLEPLLHGGGQELGARSGTVNTAAIAGFAAALRESVVTRAESALQISGLRDDLIRGVAQQVPDVILNGDSSVASEGRLPGIANLSFPGCESDALLMLLDANGIACSAGSACTAGVARSSHVLTAIGLDDDLARGALRFSLGWNSTSSDVAALTAALPDAVTRARRANTRQPVGT